MKKTFDILIIGGGLAGLTAANHLAQSKLKIGLVEKNEYPYHKVCGEYLSVEVLSYLKSINLDLESLNSVNISKLQYSTPTGESILTNLEMGGIGISRYTLDNYFFKQALKSGVDIIQDTVKTIDFQTDHFQIETAKRKQLSAKFVLGAYGKRSNIDKELKRPFIENTSGWLAVKGHYTHPDFPEDLVGLHNFRGGYCGLSRVENNAVNVCYLATYKSFKKYKNTEDYKESVLRKNPILNDFFKNAEPVFNKNLSIAQISFSNKDAIHKHVLMLGDAAGLIHPLCGNGMAMAIHSAKIASECIINYFNEVKKDRGKVEIEYRKEWNKQFKSRLKTGRLLQGILLNPTLAEVSQRIITNIPVILPQLIKRTHGKELV